MPRASALVTCPNCNTNLAPGARQCPACKLDVAKMPAFAAAKLAAQQRGIRTVSVERAGPPAWRRPATIAKTLFLLAFLAGIAWLGYHFFGPKPPPYLQLPATAQAATREFLTRLCAGDTAHDSAYALIADSARNGSDDIRGDFLQVFHNVNDYLTAEFGDQWISQTQLAPDPKDHDVIVAKIALETLHIRTQQQTPPERMQQYGSHVGIVGIDEVPVTWAADLRQSAAIGGILGGIAGQGAVNNLNAITGAYSGNRHQPPFIKKMTLLNTLRDPRSTNWRVVIQTDPLRTDPVIQARLTAILSDERYDPNVRNAAKEVLEDKVTEEERISVGL
jgi:hypothetical protein